MNKANFLNVSSSFLLLIYFYSYRSNITKNYCIFIFGVGIVLYQRESARLLILEKTYHLCVLP